LVFKLFFKVPYIQYADGSEELYDHKNDPHEWTNVAGDESFGAVKDDLRRWVTKQWAAPALPKKAFEFDPNNYTWKKRKDGKNDPRACLSAPPLPGAGVALLSFLPCGLAENGGPPS
jgi:hypothetical protein